MENVKIKLKDYAILFFQRNSILNIYVNFDKVNENDKIKFKTI